MDTRFKRIDEINIEKVIYEIRTWSKPCRVLTEDGNIEYYFCNGRFYKEDVNCDDIVLSEAQIEEELTEYVNTARTRFVNENGYIFDLTI